MTRIRPALVTLLASLAAVALASGCTVATPPPPSGSTPAGSAQDSLRAASTKERFYFVLTDRFANGDPGNDAGGLTGDRMTTGFDPTDIGFYHGGDLAGLTGKLDYIKGLGTTAIWLTPSFVNRPVQGTPDTASAGYHGYWITDFTRIDPHLGTNDEMKALIDAAHARGMKVFFDIIVNHTADVITNDQGTSAYVSKAQVPYKDAAGVAFDDRDVVGKQFPQLNTDSFPYRPVLRPGDEKVKAPSWLNDPTMYHNRGDSTFAGESSLYGDFVGLDDLFTERPEVVTGLTEVYKTWIDFGIDGFRIDTVKHVNLEFWQSFAPALRAEASKVGRPGFFAFGEVYDASPQAASVYTTAGRLQATLDFGFQAAAIEFARGKPARGLADLFVGDDWYTDTDSNAYQLPTFLGNHDMGRAASLVQGWASDRADLLVRMKFANALLYTVRGNPVVYYGDEQGLVGLGEDKLAREDLFATKASAYAGEVLLDGTTGASDRYSTSAVMYQHIAALAALREAHPALSDGVQQTRFAADGPGIFAFSRLDRASRVEYVVAANNSAEPASATFGTWTTSASFEPLYGTPTPLTSDATRSVSVTVPPWTVAVWRATTTVDAPATAPGVVLQLPGGPMSGRTEIGAQVADGVFAQATFQFRLAGASDWTTIGVDDNAPFRVFHDATTLPQGATVEYQVLLKDAASHVSSSVGKASVAPAAAAPSASASAASGTPAASSRTLIVAGDFQSELGCAKDWDPACAATALVTSGTTTTFTTDKIPAGTWQFKVALDGGWAENYGADGVRDGPNISLTVPRAGASTTFTFDPVTHKTTVASS